MKQTTTHYDPRTYQSAKKVQDYVRGEEPVYVPSYSNQQSAAAQASPPQHGQIPLPPEITVTDAGTGQPTKVEMPLGDNPTPVVQNDFTPVRTAEQRRFSAPHIEWEPTR